MSEETGLPTHDGFPADDLGFLESLGLTNWITPEPGIRIWGRSYDCPPIPVTSISAVWVPATLARCCDTLRLFGIEMGDVAEGFDYEGDCAPFADDAAFLPYGELPDCDTSDPFELNTYTDGERDLDARVRRYEDTWTIFTDGWAQVSTYDAFSCAIASEGDLYCWGTVWVAEAAPEGAFARVSVGAGHACAIDTAASLECWGNNDSGQTDAPAGSFAAVSAATGNTCAIDTDGLLQCWGSDHWGQSSPPDGVWQDVSCGSGHTCAVAGDGTVACWGYNEFGESDAPLGTFVSVSAGSSHTCAISTEGPTVCWGHNDYGQASPP